MHHPAQRRRLASKSSQFAMVYGSISTGYKSGGVNSRPFFPQQALAHDPEVFSTTNGAKSVIGYLGSNVTSGDVAKGHTRT